MSSFDSGALPRMAFTLQEVSQQLGVSARTVLREIARKKFPMPMKVGTRLLIRAVDLKAYVDGKRSW